ncbi:uncharacterized protein HD556DRAFT_1451659 [Suillus plorans]|uniref:Uncharacterized protein n=1 Tax=Suillus plorans TaxID=116603 RepID=A0A9P7A8Z1_9AGAM|nr:uncharacterized protein HD556DRAFT_1451659 [Suillus plorans]KAG1784536.1 hypothetical protein HD556DRAFT_1451659 [Suillus plorans]
MLFKTSLPASLFITVPEAKYEGAFRVIASSPTIVDMMMMTPGSLATFYLHWTLKHVTVANHTLFDSDHGAHNIGCITHADFESHNNTFWLGPAYGRLCPTLWRDIPNSDEQSLVIEWNTRFSLRSMLARSHTVWHLSDQCANLYCPYNPSNNAHTALLSPDPMPSDLTSIMSQEAFLALDLTLSPHISSSPLTWSISISGLGMNSLGQSSAPLLLCSSAPLLLCSSAPLLLCSSAPLLLCSSAPLLLCSSAPLLLYSSAPLLLCSSEFPEVPLELSCSPLDLVLAAFPLFASTQDKS